MQHWNVSWMEVQNEWTAEQLNLMLWLWSEQQSMIERVHEQPSDDVRNNDAMYRIPRGGSKPNRQVSRMFLKGNEMGRYLGQFGAQPTKVVLKSRDKAEAN